MQLGRGLLIGQSPRRLLALPREAIDSTRKGANGSLHFAATRVRPVPQQLRDFLPTSYQYFLVSDQFRGSHVIYYNVWILYADDAGA